MLFSFTNKYCTYVIFVLCVTRPIRLTDAEVVVGHTERRYGRWRARNCSSTHTTWVWLGSKRLTADVDGLNFKRRFALVRYYNVSNLSRFVCKNEPTYINKEPYFYAGWRINWTDRACCNFQYTVVRYIHCRDLQLRGVILWSVLEYFCEFWEHLAGPFINMLCYLVFSRFEIDKNWVEWIIVIYPIVKCIFRSFIHKFLLGGQGPIQADASLKINYPIAIMEQNKTENWKTENWKLILG